MTIAFIHPNKAFLPEIDAYIDFFSAFKIKTIVAKPEETNKINADVEWHFMGTDRSKRKEGKIKIHEYASASLPPFRKTKNFIKKRVNTQPDFRLFLNTYVHEQFNFNDSVPFGFRDMGVYISKKIPGEIKYDFIYCGSVSKDMHFNKLMRCFTKSSLSGKTLLVLSKNYQLHAKRYQRYSNIIFKGPVNKQDVSDYICLARFAINYKPNIAPHSYQTSTKLLEYAACGIPIITADFPWMRNFEKKYGGSYYYLKPDFSNFTWEEVNKYQYSFPDLENWGWENQIRNSGIIEFLQSKFPGIFF
jgi:glycosyltransferase involved in cell wall biosynthesis